MDTFNKHMVGTQAGKIVILNPPRMLSGEEALVFAAWIVAQADPGGDKFAKVLEEICNS